MIYETHDRDLSSPATFCPRACYMSNTVGLSQVSSYINRETVNFHVGKKADIRDLGKGCNALLLNTEAFADTEDLTFIGSIPKLV